jgi:hypothetical protein
MQNYSKIGGVLSIIAGAFGILWLFFIVFGALFMWLVVADPEFYIEGDSPEGLFAIMAAFYIIIGLFYALAGALAIVGGVFALKKKYWGWALAGSIAGSITFFLCGIPAVIFVSLGKSEFSSTPPLAPPPQTVVQT